MGLWDLNLVLCLSLTLMRYLYSELATGSMEYTWNPVLELFMAMWSPVSETIESRYLQENFAHLQKYGDLERYDFSIVIRCYELYSRWRTYRRKANFLSELR